MPHILSGQAGPICIQMLIGRSWSQELRAPAKAPESLWPPVAILLHPSEQLHQLSGLPELTPPVARLVEEPSQVASAGRTYAGTGFS
jgi:hypothetical protein